MSKRYSTALSRCPAAGDKVPPVGLVRLTVGGPFAELTVTVTGLEVLLAPPESCATAVSE